MRTNTIVKLAYALNILSQLTHWLYLVKSSCQCHSLSSDKMSFLFVEDELALSADSELFLQAPNLPHPSHIVLLGALTRRNMILKKASVNGEAGTTPQAQLLLCHFGFKVFFSLVLLNLLQLLHPLFKGSPM